MLLSYGAFSLGACFVAVLALALYAVVQNTRDVGDGESKELKSAIERQQVARVRSANLGVSNLLKWTLESINRDAPILPSSWVMPSPPSNQIARFTYFQEGRALDHILKEPWYPPRHDKRSKVRTVDFNRSCHPNSIERLMYEGAAEDAAGIHVDVQPLRDTFFQALQEAGFSGRNTDRAALKANVWLSCARTGISTHFDMGQNIVLQIQGEKVFEILEPAAVRNLHLPPTGHPYSRQSLSETISAELYTTYHLKAGDALFIPALWPHRTSSGSGLSIGVNVFAPAYEEIIVDELQKQPLPFESEWSTKDLHSAVAKYIRYVLDAMGVPISAVQKRWSLVVLAAGDAASVQCDSTLPDSLEAKIVRYARNIADTLLTRVRAADMQYLLTLDYCDDVIQGIVGVKFAKAFVSNLDCSLS